jgi:hypothetical protein
MAITSDPSNCIELNGNIEIISCTAHPAQNYIELGIGTPITIEGLSSSNYQIAIDNALDLPMTTSIVDPIELRTSGNEVLEQTFRAVRGH